MADHVNGSLKAPDNINGTLSDAGQLFGIITTEAGLIACTLSEPAQLAGSIASTAKQLSGFVASTPVQIDAALTVPKRIAPPTGYDFYEGEYEYTPTNEVQEIPIAEKVATTNIIINPIPSNYGLITWNGSVITVS